MDHSRRLILDEIAESLIAHQNRREFIEQNALAFFDASLMLDVGKTETQWVSLLKETQRCNASSPSTKRSRRSRSE